MSTKKNFSREEVNPKNPVIGKTRTIIETAFYGNNVVNVPSLRYAYELAKNAPGTIVTGMPVYHGESFGLPLDAKILLENNGAVVGRTAAARRVCGEPGVDTEDLDRKLLEAVYGTRKKKMYHAQVYIGLDPEFMVKAHLLIPEGYENTIYSWMLNFQYRSDEYIRMYQSSRPIENEGDIYVFADPDWIHPEHPSGLVYFNPELNCIAILGMRYFGEYKKGTLTMAWAIANRHGYCCCHGGEKRYNKADGSKYVMSVFGLSGSGKSTITHNRHHDKYDVTILHDDAFVINTETGSSVALEPTYFDKTADYPLSCDATKYLLTVMNCGATLDEDNKVVLVPEDVRNGNGRAIKSKLWSPNRVDKIEEPVNAIFWIMKDPVLPPLVRVRGGALGSAMGATLATKRTSAENLLGVDKDQLVYEPYANPFRSYPLRNDYFKFKKLIDERNTECYIINTGDFMGKKVRPSDTLGVIEAIVDGKATFTPWAPFEGLLDIMEWDGFIPDMTDEAYLLKLQKSMMQRRRFISERYIVKDGYDSLPTEALDKIDELVRRTCDLLNN